MTDEEIVGWRPMCLDCGATGQPVTESLARELTLGHKEVRDCSKVVVETVTAADEETRQEAIGA